MSEIIHPTTLEYFMRNKEGEKYVGTEKVYNDDEYNNFLKTHTSYRVRKRVYNKDIYFLEDALPINNNTTHTPSKKDTSARIASFLKKLNKKIFNWVMLVITTLLCAYLIYRFGWN